MVVKIHREQDFIIIASWKKTTTFNHINLIKYVD